MKTESATVIASTCGAAPLLDLQGGLAGRGSALGDSNARHSGNGCPDPLPVGRERSGMGLVIANARPRRADRGSTAERPPSPGGTPLQRLPVCLGQPALAGELTLVPEARGLVVFAHACSSSPSPQHRLVADILHTYRLDTLMFNLLTAAEGRDRERIFDIDLLTQRLVEALRWARADDRTGGLCTGLFGAGTGAAAALRTAAQRPGWVAATVLRSGRADLAGPWLARVLAPTLLIIGGQDAELLGLNRAVARGLRCEWRLEVMPGATHRFEESGTIETVAHLAGNWFGDRLRRPLH